MLRLIRALLSAAALLALPLSHAAEAPLSWYGDYAAMRGYAVDDAKIYELKRHQAIIVKPIGSVSSLDAVSRGEIDLAAVARGPSPAQPQEANLDFVPVAWDSLVMIVHPGNAVRDVTVEQLRDVYLGKIKDWSGLGGKPGAINLYVVAGPDDGLEFSLRELLFGRGNAVVAAERWYINTKQLEDAVAIDPAGLGVTSLSGIADNRKVRALTIDGIAPGAGTLVTASYPLITPLYLVSRAEHDRPARVGALRDELLAMLEQPALRDAVKKRQILLARENTGLPAAREALMEKLSSRLAWVPLVEPVIPIDLPSKNMAGNRPRHDDEEIVLVERGEKSGAALADSRRRNKGVRVADSSTLDYCRPAPVCGG